MIILISTCGRCPFMAHAQRHGSPQRDHCARGAEYPIRDGIPEDCPLKVEEVTYRLEVTATGDSR